jgi:hypothetical protein
MRRIFPNYHEGSLNLYIVAAILVSTAVLLHDNSKQLAANRFDPFTQASP